MHQEFRIVRMFWQNVHHTSTMFVYGKLDAHENDKNFDARAEMRFVGKLKIEDTYILLADWLAGYISG